MLELPTVTAICYEGSRLSPDQIKYYELMLRHVNRTVRFKSIKFFAHTPHQFEGVEQIAVPHTSRMDYSRWCLHQLGEHFDTEHVLIFQWDGYPLNPHLWTDEFLQYDYIGSPWTPKQHRRFRGLNPAKLVGNGGFSLRSRKLYQELFNHPTSNENEDLYICCDLRAALEANGVKFAPLDVAKRFAVEAQLSPEHTITNTFGFHGGHKSWVEAIPSYPQYANNFLP